MLDAIEFGSDAADPAWAALGVAFTVAVDDRTVGGLTLDTLAVSASEIRRMN